MFKPEDKRAKYYNSKDSPWFNKGSLLFGLDVAKKEMQHSARAFLVEGYTDCVAMIKYGYRETVATLGTACTIEHLKALARYITTLYVLYDGDAAGQKAILRLTNLCWRVNLEPRVITLPDSLDPASFLDGGGDLAPLVERAPNIFSFYVQSLTNDFAGKPLGDKLKAAHNVVAMVATQSDALKRDFLLQQASDAMQVPLESLRAMASKERVPTVVDDEETEADVTGGMKSFATPLEERILAAVINTEEGEEHHRFDQEQASGLSPDAQLVFKTWTGIQGSQTAGERFERLLAGLPEEMRPWIMQISTRYDKLSDAEFQQLLARFSRKRWKQAVQTVKLEIMKAKQSQDTERLQTLIEEFTRLKQALQEEGHV